jgi:Trypsin-like peptidase domain
VAGIPAARVVAVFAKLDTDKTQVGSGYLLDARRVLTARHCTYDKVTGRPASALSITRASDGACAAATVSAASAALDVALLAVADNPPWELKLPGGPVTFGRVDREHTGQLDDCEAVGYPLWQASEAGDYRDLAELHGYIYALEGRERRRLVLREPKLLGAGWARAAIPDPGGAAEAGGVASGQSAWNGLSGAAVFHDGLLLGVVIEHHPRQGSTAVQIRPVDAIVVASDEDAIHLRAALGLTGLDAIRPVGTASLDALVAQVSPEGRLPAVGACDPFEAGVVRTIHDNAGTAPYVARDVDKAALEPALREHRLVVLLGPSAAGKSRTAMQAARTLLPGYLFLQPLPGVALRSAFGRFGDQHVLVWLDDLDRFIDGGPRGLTVGLLGEISVSRPGWKFLATLRTDRRETILAEDDERSRALRQVLGAGTVIGLGRSLSNEERVRAELVP